MVSLNAQDSTTRKTITSVLGVLVVLWVGYTVSAVLRFGGAVLVDLSTTSRIMSVRNDEVIYSAVGLTYHGAGGAILVVVEAIVVLAALWFGLRGRGWKRLAAVFVLVTWTALWLGNAIWLQSRGWDRSADLGIMVVAMSLMLAWAGLCLTDSSQRGNL
jgi:hypothetical protein